MPLRRIAPTTCSAALLLVGCGGPAANAPAPGAPPAGAPATAGVAWSPDPAQAAGLGPERPVLGGRYTTRVPAGLDLEPRSTDDLVAFKAGEDELMFQAEAGIPPRVTAERYINDNRKMMGNLTTDYPGFKPVRSRPAP